MSSPLLINCNSYVLDPKKMLTVMSNKGCYAYRWQWEYLTTGNYVELSYHQSTGIGCEDFLSSTNLWYVSLIMWLIVGDMNIFVYILLYIAFTIVSYSHLGWPFFFFIIRGSIVIHISTLLERTMHCQTIDHPSLISYSLVTVRSWSFLLTKL